MPRRHAMVLSMKVCVEPESTKATSMAPMMETQSCMVLLVVIPVKACRDIWTLSSRVSSSLVVSDPSTSNQ